MPSGMPMAQPRIVPRFEFARTGELVGAVVMKTVCMPWLLDEMTVWTVTTTAGMMAASEVEDVLARGAVMIDGPAAELVVGEMTLLLLEAERGAIVGPCDGVDTCVGVDTATGVFEGVFDEARGVLGGALNGAAPMVVKALPSASAKKIVSAVVQQSQDRFPSQQYRPGEHWSIASLPVAVPSTKVVS